MIKCGVLTSLYIIFLIWVKSNVKRFLTNFCRKLYWTSEISLKNTTGSKYLIIQEDLTGDLPYIVNFECEAPPPKDGIYAVKVRHVVMTGDIAFYSYCFRIVHMAGSWCWMCRLARSQWQASVQDRQDIAYDDAALWTISGLQEHGKRGLLE